MTRKLFAIFSLLTITIFNIFMIMANFLIFLLKIFKKLFYAHLFIQIITFLDVLNAVIKPSLLIPAVPDFVVNTIWRLFKCVLLFLSLYPSKQNTDIQFLLFLTSSAIFFYNRSLLDSLFIVDRNTLASFSMIKNIVKFKQKIKRRTSFILKIKANQNIPV